MTAIKLQRNVLFPALLLAIMAAVFIGIHHTLPPSASYYRGSPFAVEKAFEHIKIIGAKPHPSGSRENTEVRAYILSQLLSLGFQPQIQSVWRANPGKKFAGEVHNVLVRVPGTRPGKALALVAHYDSVPFGPGAADDGASVAAMLEVLEVIKQQQAVLANDLIFLFTDGEEMGLLGAEAFVGQHPWAKDIALVLNFEYRGNSGKFLMFETSPGNGKLIEGLAAAVPSLSANSMMYEVYRRLPHGTDFTAFKNKGIPGMNFAAIEGLGYYHTKSDKPENLNQDTLRQEGNIMLALVDYFGNRPLNNLSGEDQVYFDFPGLGLVHYPVSYAWPLTAGLSLVFLGQLVLACKKRLARVSRIAMGAAAYLFTLTLSAGGSQLLWLAITQVYFGGGWLISPAFYNSYLPLLAFLGLNSLLIVILQLWIVSNWLFEGEYIFSIQFCCLIGLIISTVWLPGFTFILFWPLAAEMLASSLFYAGWGSRLTNLILSFLACLPGTLIFIPLIKALFTALTINSIGVILIYLGVWLGLLTTEYFNLVNNRK